MKLRIFLSYDFSEDRVDGPMSAAEIWQWFKEKIEEFGHGRVEVITAHAPDPIFGIPDKISEAIRGSDIFFCLLTKRFRNGNDDWNPSTYVVSEAGYATSHFQDRFPIKRICGFVEEGVKREKLGIAFSSGIEIPMFNRAALRDCETKLREYVHKLLEKFEPDFPIDAESIRKNVMVRRGAVTPFGRITRLLHSIGSSLVV